LTLPEAPNLDFIPSDSTPTTGVTSEISDVTQTKAPRVAKDLGSYLPPRPERQRLRPVVDDLSVFEPVRSELRPVLRGGVDKLQQLGAGPGLGGAMLTNPQPKETAEAIRQRQLRGGTLTTADLEGLTLPGQQELQHGQTAVAAQLPGAEGTNALRGMSLLS